MQAATDSGINMFDTANVYGAGRSESLIGAFNAGLPKKLFVATKFGRGDVYPGGITRQSLRDSVAASARRLRAKAIDLLQLHCIPMNAMAGGAVFDWLRELQAEGSIRHFGASVESVEEALLCCEQEGLTSLQIIFNILRQKPIRELFPVAREKKIAIVVRLPLASGVLSGKFTAATRFAASDHRNYNRDGAAFNVGETFAGIPFEKAVEIAGRIKPLVPPDMTMAQMALRWILDYPEVSVLIPGASKPEQVASNAGASEMAPLSEQVHAELAAIYKYEIHPHIRGPY
jgi:aryl-alcohol dehydrogenase-like predicted oxidoreductase